MIRGKSQQKDSRLWAGALFPISVVCVDQEGSLHKSPTELALTREIGLRREGT